MSMDIGRYGDKDWKLPSKSRVYRAIVVWNGSNQNILILRLATRVTFMPITMKQTTVLEKKV